MATAITAKREMARQLERIADAVNVYVCDSVRDEALAKLADEMSSLRIRLDELVVAVDSQTPALERIASALEGLERGRE